MLKKKTKDNFRTGFYYLVLIKLTATFYLGTFAILFFIIYFASGYFFDESSLILSLILGALISIPLVTLFYINQRKKLKSIQEEREKLDQERKDFYNKHMES